MTAAAGVALVAFGLALDPIFAINKRLWTSSFALFTDGVSALGLAWLGLAWLQRRWRFARR